MAEEDQGEVRFHWVGGNDARNWRVNPPNAAAKVFDVGATPFARQTNRSRSATPLRPALPAARYTGAGCGAGAAFRLGVSSTL